MALEYDSKVKANEPFHETHRPLRILLVGDERTTDILPWSLDCLCLKYISLNAENLHTLDPSKYKKITPLNGIRTACKAAMLSGRPYDLIISDDQNLVTQIQDAFETSTLVNPGPNPGVMLYVKKEFKFGDTPRDDSLSLPPMEPLRNNGTCAFNIDEADTNGVRGLTVFEQQLEKALGGEAKIADRLALKDGEESMLGAWRSQKNKKKYQEVNPEELAPIPKRMLF